MPLGKDYKYHFHFHKKAAWLAALGYWYENWGIFTALDLKARFYTFFPLSSKYSDVFINEILLLACISKYDRNPSSIEISQTPFLKK